MSALLATLSTDNMNECSRGSLSGYNVGLTAFLELKNPKTSTTSPIIIPQGNIEGNAQ